MTKCVSLPEASLATVPNCAPIPHLALPNRPWLISVEAFVRSGVSPKSHSLAPCAYLFRTSRAVFSSALKVVAMVCWLPSLAPRSPFTQLAPVLS
ncbi:unnamed protein product [Heligmosomoides polygyrus]|uniref:Uncharacterized protein n=1 Tax=Heligmosomoides polygyrus TaxID=6339 RepID=A0A183F893_HELPZ|nr:unnamed protein product [Heligmosomoides polygyrus]